MRSETSRKLRTVAATLAVAMVGAFVAVSGGVAHAAGILSAGPLVKIEISADLNCNVAHVGDAAGEWFEDTACGTFVSAGGVLYGPASIPAGSNATGVPGYTSFTPVSQAGPTGAGTDADPFVVATIVALGQSGIQLTEVDTYVVGQESYRTDVSLATTSGQETPVIVYRGGDCFLQDSDFGLGEVLNGVAPICKALPQSVNPERIEGFYPLSPGSHYLENYYATVWAAIGSQQTLPNSCDCASEIDNGVALSWDATVPASGSLVTSSLTIFSPVGAAPVAFSKAADAPTVAAGANDGYTITLTNAGAVAATISQIVDTLPSGFAYVAGSSSGATTSDPTVMGSALTWSGSFSVPAAANGTPGTLTLHFGVTATTTPGTYTNTVAGSGAGVTTIAAIDVAPITVAGANQPPSVSANGPYTGLVNLAAFIGGTATDPDGDTLSVAWTVSGPGTCSIGDAAALSTTVTCDTEGVYTLTLTVNDGHNPAVSASTTFVVTTPILPPTL